MPFFHLGNVTVKADNAFIPATVRAQMTALKLTSILIGGMNQDLPVIGSQSDKITTRNVKELVEFARANKGKVNMASAGVGSTSHLAGTILSQMGKFEALHVPHKGGGPSVASVVAGQTHFTFAPAPAAMSQVKAGRLRALAHSLPARSKMLGDMPAVNESLPGYDYSTWAGLLAPKGLPKPMQDRLFATLQKTLGIPAVLDGLVAQGADILLIQGEEYRKFIQADLVATARFVQAAGLQAE